MREHTALCCYISQHVYSILENKCNLIKVYLDKGSQSDSPAPGFVYMSPGALGHHGMLMVLIQDKGTIRCGVWSWRAVAHEGLERGSQIPYVRWALEESCAVLLMNPNEGAITPEEHVLQVWDQLLLNSTAEQIAVVAHGYGGLAFVHLLCCRLEEIQQRKCAVAFVDSSHNLWHQPLKPSGHDWIKPMMFVRVHSVAVLRRFFPPASTLVKYHASNPSTSCSALCTTRSLSTGWTLKKDAPQHKPELDLDVWKSVMRSQASQNEKAKHREEETATEEEDDDSPIEASRTLVDMWRQAGKKVPENITDEQLETLAELTTKSSKRKFLKYLAIKEGYKKANKEKKEKKKADRLTEVNKEEAGRTVCLEEAEEEGEGEPKLRNTYLMQFWTRSIDKALGWRAAQAMQFGQPLVYDMSYDQHMTRRELENTISQLMESEGWNRRSVDPFHLHFCNLQPDGAYKHELLKRYGQETWDRLFITATSQRHVDTFPREDLVYLTADSPNTLRTFDHSKVYIIGAMVDRSIQSGVSLANAKRLNLSTARLPLDEYLHWEIGAKNLTLDQMIRIMLMAKETGELGESSGVCA
ncbi:hypothetical protein QTP86_003008 [Hemibagrus guttatus]|nr:hypothetical protein QTP86_003008 [Hemibagrus guttatus]